MGFERGIIMQSGISTGELLHQKASGICSGPFDNAEYGTEKPAHSCCNQRKSNMGDCSMSFVGLMRSDEGIVAFADSKGTINGAAGLYSETQEVKKYLYIRILLWLLPKAIPIEPIGALKE